MKTRITMLAAAVALLAACAPTTLVYQSQQALPAPLAPTVAVLPPDVVLSLQHAGGVLEARQDWSEQVQESIAQTIDDYMFDAGIDFIKADSEAATLAKANTILDSIQLAMIQGGGIGDFRTYAVDMDDLAGLSAEGADYALLVVYRSARASGGRIGAALLAGMVGANVKMGGTQFRSALIDLRNGYVKWANFDDDAMADFGNPLDADPKKWRKVVDHLLTGLPL